VVDRPLAASLQDIEKSLDVAPDVGIRVFDRIPHPGLCRQVNHPVEPLGLEQRVEKRLVRQVRLDKTIPCPSRTPNQGMFPERCRRLDTGLGQPRVFQLHRIVVVQVVEPHHLVATLRQAAHGVKTDESGRAGHEYFHRSSSFL
jgi:hypothetical protein